MMLRSNPCRARHSDSSLCVTDPAVEFVPSLCHNDCVLSLGLLSKT
jgi:hypothetical protein